MMDGESLDNYNKIRGGVTGFYEQKRGLIAVWGKEAVQFLDGLITNNVKKLEVGPQMLAAFPNAQGRLLAVVRVLGQGDRFLFETEEATREKVFQNLFRFTFAGDFFVEDLSDNYRYFEMLGTETPKLAGGFFYNSATSNACFISNEQAEYFRSGLTASGAVEISDDLYEVLRIENGVLKYGVDMDETTIVPELGIDGLISYNKGCYIGQEIIARIHFRGHVAKQLTGVILSEPRAVVTGFLPDAELRSPDGKNAGKITSVTFSPKLHKTIALGYVRYDYLADGTKLQVIDQEWTVKNLPFFG
ncbi:MAG: YgfZ/GcvT domain-containing protein [Pyrinomonadaceae bacterium]|nr:folate-binding protein YgfZ [Blastocatellia bacterium]